MHLVIFAISLTLFIASVILLSVESKKPRGDGDFTYVCLSIIFSIAGFMIMALYSIIFYLESIKIN